MGALDGRDIDLFEAHLAECDDCAERLESFVEVVAVLVEVNADALIKDHVAGRIQ
ncbi:zf-HC2 domain-containing protein [Actinoplanes campanulatus]|uniref:zf-HC2 domain-containing protein n=1 Tax=Actinoplanes campanulatus TaxID=113559 RepID=UPI003570B6E3